MSRLTLAHLRTSTNVEEMYLRVPHLWAGALRLHLVIHSQEWQRDDSPQLLSSTLSYFLSGDVCALKWVHIQLGLRKSMAFANAIQIFSFGMLSSLAEQKLFLSKAIASIFSSNTKAASVLHSHRTNFWLYWIFSSRVILQRSFISIIGKGSDSKLHFYEW